MDNILNPITFFKMVCELRPLTLDYSGVDDFWDAKNKRSLSKEQAVKEGYFDSIEDAETYLDELGGFED